jgi:hypothetical protein
MALSFSLQIGIRATQTSPLDLSTPVDPLVYNLSAVFASGTGSGQCDKLFHDTRTLTTGASEDLDLAGSLLDFQGNAITFAKVKFILIHNKSTTRTLTVGGAASNQFINWVGNANDVINLPPSTTGAPSVLLLLAPASGYAVTAATGDLLKITNDSGASAVYDIIIAGTSA